MSTEYDQQAEQFLARNGLKLRATLRDTKTPQWGADGKHGHHYRVTLSKGKAGTAEHTGNIRSATRLTFDFWNSVAAMEKGEEPTAYGVLACISSDAYCPETFEDFCAEYGYEADSIKALQAFRRCSAFAKRLRAFFTETELQELSEIQ